MTKFDLTKLHLRWYALRESVVEEHVFPSIRELVELWGLNTTSHARKVLQDMESRGWIERLGKGQKARNYRITGQQIFIPENPTWKGDSVK